MSAAVQLTASQLLASGETIVVPGDPAAQQLRHLHDAEQQKRGLRAWSPADVLTWGQWLRSLWSAAITNGSEQRLLLNAAQEHSLWMEIVQQRNAAADTLNSADALADLAAAAWQLSESYGATARLTRFASTHDARTFANWAESFRHRCRAEGYVSRASLETLVRPKLAGGEIRVPQPLTFAGFTTFTPAQTALLDKLHESGENVRTAEVTAEATTAPERFLLQAENADDELHAIAQWIRRFIQTRTAAGLNARVGVLIPDLDAIHNKVSSAFRSTLAPELQRIVGETGSAPFAIARSTSLRAEPLIAAALDLIHWAEKPLSREAVSALLLSPYLTPESALEGAAQFDACVLRSARLLRPEVDLRWLVKELRRSPAAFAIAWPQSLAKFLATADDLTSPRSFAQWTEFMRRILRSAGWPGEQALAAHEAATSRAWDHALDGVATLDFNGARATFSEAVQALERQIAKAAAQTSSGMALVQVLQPSAADGMAFDAIVVARATDGNWPRTPSANPLIDWQLQAQLGMPGTDRSASAREAKSAISHWMNAATVTVFSFAAHDGENPQRLSPYIAELQLEQQSAGDLLTPEADDHIDPEVFEDIDPLPPLPSSHVHGGATILQNQAACGFRAFAEIRLRAQELEAKDLGYDARERGNLLHGVMQRFWAEVKTQRKLRAMPVEERRSLLIHHIEEHLNKNPAHTHDWDTAYLRLQKQRLVRLLSHWLDSELQRGEFEVLATENRQDISIGPLDLTVRLDRIDRVDGGVVLIDYKTGSAASAADWEGERPDEPQLPLYSLLPDAGELAGLAFARIKPGKAMSWQGYAAQPNVIPGRDTSRDLAPLQDEWRTHLTMLAQAFADGDTSVQPKTYPSTCAFCAQRLLCRLDTATLLDTEDPDEQIEEEQA